MEMDKRYPLKRHEALAKFSREHHNGLLLCWKIRQGIKHEIQPDRIAAYILFFFDEDLKKHFKEEEETLFPRLDVNDHLRLQAISEHQNIYSLIERVGNEMDGYDELNEFADTLDEHIRFEERILFNHIQTRLQDAELTELANRHEDSACDSNARWNDHFWK
jgi:hemerythrin-like domain-containing protein